MTPMWQKKENSALQPISEKDAQSHLYGDIGLSAFSNTGHEKPVKEKKPKTQVDIEIESIKKEVDKTRKKAYRKKGATILNKGFILKTLAGFIIIALAFFVVKGVIKFVSKMQANSVKTASATNDAAEIKYNIQVAVSKEKNDAENFVQKLIQKGYPAFIDTFSTKTGSARFRICVGPIISKKEADALLNKLKNEKETKGSFFITLQ